MNKGRASRIVGVMVAAAIATAAFAVPASASPGQIACTYTSVGNVCMEERNNGYDAGFYNKSVYSLVDFNLQTSSGTYGDYGAFWSVPGQYNSFFFAVGYKSWARVCLYSRDNKFSPICTPYLYN